MTCRSLPFRHLAFAALLGLPISCGGGGNPPTQPTPTPGAPVIACPAPVTVNADTVPAVVNYPAPVVTAGSPPVASSCSTESGKPFQSGTTQVVCTAVDALARSSQCTFQVQVTLTARLAATKFLAFGDSITEGEVSPPLPGATFRAVEEQNSYPTVLLGLLRERYPTQVAELQVFNAGQSGRVATEDEDRLVDEIARRAPEALLLMHGTNDVNQGLFPGAIASSLRADVRRAQQRGVEHVFLSTLLPQVPGRFRAYNPVGIVETNFVIRDAAGREGAILVDVFAALDPKKQQLIGEDGLHPTREGYRLMAETFFEAIRKTLHGSSTPQSPQPLFVHPAGR